MNEFSNFRPKTKVIIHLFISKYLAQPPPPANVSYSDVRETKVDIIWDPPELHQLFSIKRYYISYLKHGEKKWSNDTVGVYDDQSIRFQLDNLESDTFYTLKVTAENDYYLGKESKRMEIKTLKIKGTCIICTNVVSIQTVQLTMVYFINSGKHPILSCSFLVK